MTGKWLENYYQSMLRNKGFTLIELLIAIAIIGIISTVAVVQLRGGVDKARAGKIAAELRQVDNALTIWMGSKGHWLTECELDDMYGGAFCESSHNPEPSIRWLIANTDFSEVISNPDVIGLTYEYDNDGDEQVMENGCLPAGVQPYKGVSLYVQEVKDKWVVDGLIDEGDGNRCGKVLWDNTEGRIIWKLGGTINDL